jgi:DNA phosphorothioation-dependent restriction protein DptH
MALAKVSESLVREICALGQRGQDPAEIARILNLKKMQVSAILAHEDQKKTRHSRDAEFEAEIPERLAESAAITQGGGAVAFEAPPTIAAWEPEELTSNEIYIGDDREYGDPIYWTPSDAQAVQNPHIMIMGESGSGKTYAAQCIIAELAQRGIPSVIFDYGQSFELESVDRVFRKFAAPREYLVGEDGLALNPLQVFPTDIHGPNTVASRVSDVFDAVYRLGDIQRKVLIDAILRAFDRHGVQIHNKTTWQQPSPNLSVLQEVLEELSLNKEYPNYKNATGVAARLTTFFMLNSFRSDGAPWSWDSFINDQKQRVHVLQFRGLEGKTQRILVEMLLWHLFFYLKSLGQGPLRLYCVLDEAHHLSFRDSGPVDSLLREARKFGLGLVFASQQPEDFSPAAFSNSASKLVFQTADPSLKVSKFLAAKCANYGDANQIRDLISVLKQGEAFFITKNRGHLLTVADLNKRATLWKQN